MVYGFARQSGGQARIYSELGKGTTMSLEKGMAVVTNPFAMEYIARRIAAMMAS